MVLISVCITTFNKEDFIAQALDSIINQKTNFDFEILIYDDASTDATVSIINKYQEKHPNIILFANLQNEYGNGIYGINERNLFPKAKGTYIAMCDGDDYWIDENKLQIQVDFLDNNENYVLCCHDGKVFYQKSNTFANIYDKPFDNPITNEKIIRMGGNLCPTSSIMFRNIVQQYPDFIFKAMSNDRALTYFLATLGSFWFINKKMCVYRVHTNGLIAAGDKKVRLKYLESNIELANNYLKFVSYNKYLVGLVIKERSNLIKNLFYFGGFKNKLRLIKYLNTFDIIKIIIYRFLNFFK